MRAYGLQEHYKCGQPLTKRSLIFKKNEPLLKNIFTRNMSSQALAFNNYMKPIFITTKQVRPQEKCYLEGLTLVPKRVSSFIFQFKKKTSNQYFLFFVFVVLIFPPSLCNQLKFEVKHKTPVHETQERKKNLSHMTKKTQQELSSPKMLMDCIQFALVIRLTHAQMYWDRKTRPRLEETNISVCSEAGREFNSKREPSSSSTLPEIKTPSADKQ